MHGAGTRMERMRSRVFHFINAMGTHGVVYHIDEPLQTRGICEAKSDGTNWLRRRHFVVLLNPLCNEIIQFPTVHFRGGVISHLVDNKATHAACQTSLDHHACAPNL